MLLAIPVVAFLTHRSFSQNFGAENLERAVNAAIADWQAAPQVDFQAEPSLAMGAPSDKARLTLVEFADFRCGHCKLAAPSLHAFVKAHSDVRLEFYSFPLDGACNEAIERSTGLSCRLAKATYCAEQQQQGWAMHDLIFSAQDKINGMHTIDNVDEQLKTFSTELKTDWEQLKTCMESPEAQRAIMAQAKAGEKAKVMGTPAIYANGRSLPRGQFIPVLRQAREAASNQQAAR